MDNYHLIPLRLQHITEWEIKVINLFVSARLNRDVKQTLELDWSDKQQAYSLDDQCGRYNNRSTDTQWHPSSAVLQDQCVPNLVPYLSSAGVTQTVFSFYTPFTIHFSISKVLFLPNQIIMNSSWLYLVFDNA